MLNRLLANKFLRSSATYTVVSFLASFIAYLINVVIARSFTLADYGEYVSAFSYLIFLGVPFSALGLIVIERIGRADIADRENVAVSIEKWLEHEVARFTPILILLAGVLGSAMYFRGNMSLVAICFVFLHTFLSIFAIFYGSVLQSYKTFSQVGIYTISTTIIKFVLSIIVIVVAPQLFWLFFVFLLSDSLSYLIGRKMIRVTKVPSQMKQISFSKVRHYARRKSILVPLFTTLGLVGLANIDVVLVKKFFDSDTAGLYASLSVIGKIIFYLAAPLASVAFTYFTGSDSKDQTSKILLLLTVILGLGGLAAAALYVLFPELIITIIFGQKYLRVSHLIGLAAIFGTIYSLVNLYVQYFIAKKSSFAYLGILAVVFQTIGIYIFHQSLYNVMMVNILINGGLLCVYISEAVRRELFVS